MTKYINQIKEDLNMTSSIIIDSKIPKRNMNELSVMNEMLDFTNAKILEIGCGNARRAEEIVSKKNINSFKAVEIDQVVHQLNLSKKIDKLSFDSYSCEDIHEINNSFDIVFLLKSFHHVHPEKMNKGLQEINRVLKNDGFLYISEPIFHGNYNNVIKLFHNEKKVRKLAFEAIKLSIERNIFKSVKQYFYNSVLTLNSFEEFENNIIKSTHTSHNLSQKLYKEVREKFESYKDMTKNPNYIISLLSPWLDILLDRMQFLTPNAIQEEQKIAGSEQQCRDLKTSSGGQEIIFEILKTLKTE